MNRHGVGRRRSFRSSMVFVLAAAALLAAVMMSVSLSNMSSSAPTLSAPTVASRVPREALEDPIATEASAPLQTAMFTKVTAAYDKSITEIIREDPEVDGTLVGELHSNQSGVDGGAFISNMQWKGKCFYTATNFCVLNGALTMFHDPKDTSVRTRKLRMCNEFSKHSPLIRLAYTSKPMPDVLPAPLNTITRGWVLQFWCQDLFHMTLSLMPAFLTAPFLGPHPDIYIRIAKGLRRKGGYCRIKLGDPRNYSDVYNTKWGGDKQFPFAGNPYWPFYKLLTPDPHRVLPLYNGATKKSVCYHNGVIDKLYLKNTMGNEARNYSNSMLDSLGVIRGPPRQCRRYRLTMIDGRGMTRRLTNVPELVAIAQRKGFIAQSVALETLPITEQLRLITSTDVLMGMHGNGMTWLQFLPPGSAVVELIGVWYTPYALLWGHKHFHSSMKNNMVLRNLPYNAPFQHNETEVERLLDEVSAYLDSTSCVETPFVPPNEKLENLYGSCVPQC